ncbi:MAG: hypothetical protein V4660_17960 [Pseudomonadota bacterium]
MKKYPRVPFYLSHKYIVLSVVCIFSGCASVVNTNQCGLPAQEEWERVDSNSKVISEFFLKSKVKHNERAIWYANKDRTMLYSCGLALGASPACGSQNNVYTKNSAGIAKENTEIVVCSSSPY